MKRILSNQRIKMLALLSSILGSLFFAHIAQAFTCEAKAHRVQENNVILNTDNTLSGATLFFIKNISDQPIWINHPMDKDGQAKAGWGSYLKPHRFSALLLRKKNFTINCTADQAHKFKALVCEKVVRVCVPDLKVDPATSGNYWFVENKDWQPFIKAVTTRLQHGLSPD